MTMHDYVIASLRLTGCPTVGSSMALGWSRHRWKPGEQEHPHLHETNP
jgi:hypothetical protein